MEKAIQTVGRAHLANTEHVHDGRQPEFEYALSSDILAMTRVYSGAHATSARRQRRARSRGRPLPFDAR